MNWWSLPCGCEAGQEPSDSDARAAQLIIAEGCGLHRKYVPEDGIFVEHQYGPIEVAGATRA